MAYATKDGAKWRELPAGADVVIDDMVTSYASVLSWTPQFRTARGIKEIQDTPPPAGKIIVSSSIEDADGKPFREYVLQDAQVFVDPQAGFIPVALYRQRLEKLGMLDDFSAYLGQFPTLLVKVLTLEDGLLDPAYPDIVAAFESLKVPQQYRDYLNASPSLGVPDVPDF